ncbi:MAG: ABC transporter ATP-binding protein [Acidobacteriota bacterium]|nr:ABC transporter ATP-binding protein [Blastocatellia bacterium]MDW8411287.1 ABC transporter ATP-binding protein [Acidobacteriota bacterium]
MSEAQRKVLCAIEISKTYVSGTRRINVLDGLDISIWSGESVAICGPSGVGKSTLLHLLGGLDRPDKGRVILDGFDISELSDVDLARVRNKIVGFVFQSHNLLQEFSALENTMMPLLIAREDVASSRERAKDVLAKVGLGKRLNHRPSELSGGEAARVAIARALVTRPKVLLADEPTGNLDARTGQEVQDLLAEMHREYGLAVVIVTHNERLAAGCARVLELENGRLKTASDYYNEGDRVECLRDIQKRLAE